jgi:hypothetical protein
MFSLCFRKHNNRSETDGIGKCGNVWRVDGRAEGIVGPGGGGGMGMVEWCLVALTLIVLAFCVANA